MLTPTPASHARLGLERTILLVEDDPSLERTMRAAFEAGSYRVASAGTGADACAFLLANQADVILLDLGLPDSDGLLLISSIQKLTSSPVVICSARHTIVDRVLGLKLGADDFVPKPFDLDELDARVQAVLRRSAKSRGRSAANDELRVGDLVIRKSRAQVSINDQPVHLTPIEFRMLVTLASQPGQIIGRAALIEGVWGYTPDLASGHIVDVHMGRLRLKLRAVDSACAQIVTVRGRGYAIAARSTDPTNDQPDTNVRSIGACRRPAVGASTAARA
jgi:DNA-binding response OmpR family regulator